MTNRQTKKRTRNAAGYQHVSGYTTTDAAPAIQSQLLTAAEVDAEIEKKEQGDARS